MLTSLLILIFISAATNIGDVSKSLTAENLADVIKVETTSFPEVHQAEVGNSNVPLEEFKNLPKSVAEKTPEPPLSWSHAGVVVDAESGKVLYGKDEKKKMPLASLTKMMTAIIIDERISDWNEEVYISKEAAFAGGAAVHLKWDERVRAGDLFKAMLMNSDNSAAIALSEHIAGSKDKFVEMMNQKSQEIGALDTHFTDPSGLEDENSFSTAYDMARITQYALKKEKIVEVMQTKGPIEIKSCDGNIVHRVGNTNVFLKDDNLVNRVICGKTGFTYKAGYNLMMSMYDKEKKRKAIGVILNSDDKMRWEEMEEMIEWSFNNYTW